MREQTNQKRDYYEVLNIEPSATVDQIKKAFRKLAKIYHPDINKDPKAEDKFKEINEAYDVLKDKNKRKAYDMFGHNVNHGRAGGGDYYSSGNFDNSFGDFGFEDIFSSFSDFFKDSSFQNNQGGGRQTRGKIFDRVFKLKIDIFTVARGDNLNIDLPIKGICKKCDGTKAYSSKYIIKCRICKGSGFIMQNIANFFQAKVGCNNCGGSGNIVSKYCSKCKGNGYEESSKTFYIKIPPNVREGEHLFIGKNIINKIYVEKLYIKVHIQKYDLYRIDGSDVIAVVPLYFTKVITGALVNVLTLDKTISEVSIPPNSRENIRYKIKGLHGFPIASNNPFSLKKYGNFFVQIKIIYPDNRHLSRKELLYIKKMTDYSRDEEYRRYLHNIKNIIKE